MMVQEFKSEVNLEISNRVRGFCADHTHMKGYIKHSNSVVSEYNGRQIFEMLQNVDDQMRSVELSEGDRVCQIELDKDKKSLYFRNKGEPFSIAGIKSIMYPDTSSKDNLTIGNKGLGFRSLLNWQPKSIIIRSAGLAFEFSNEIIADILKRNTILSSLDGASKLPMLTFPDVKEWDTSNGWVTEIELVGVDFARKIGTPPKSIEDELVEFNPELMLFLPHLCQVEILETSKGLSSSTVYKSSGWEPVSNCKVNNASARVDERTIQKIASGEIEFTTRWIAYRGDGEFRNDVAVEEGESRVYKYAIAIPCEVSKQKLFQTLYNYLPLRHVELHLPCLVHATVKLDGRRDVLVTHDANQCIFDDVLPKAFQDFAEALKSHPIIPDRWLPYCLLSPLSQKKDGYVGLLYKRLRDIRRTGMFCPCVDGNFRNEKDCCYYPTLIEDGCRITDFFNNFTTLLPHYILKGEPQDFLEHTCAAETIVGCVNQQLLLKDAKVPRSGQDLAELAFVLWRMARRGNQVFFDRSKTNQALDGIYLFHDDSGKILGPESKNVYTPAAGDGLVFPDYMQTDFISQKEWTAITERFKSIIDKSSDDNKIRGFCNAELRDIANFEYYDRYAAAKKMIQSSAEWLTVDMNLQVDEKRTVVHQLLTALWQNYRDDKEPGRLRERVPLFVRAGGGVVFADELLLSSARDFYGDLLPDEVYLTDAQIKELLGAIQIDDPIPFLKYLGVRSDVRIEVRTIGAEDDYFLFLEKIIGVRGGGLPSRAKCSSPLTTRLAIHALRDAEQIRRLDVPCVLRLLEVREYDGLSYWIGESLKELEFSWKEENKLYAREQKVAWSYVSYQLRGILAHVILEENDAVLARLGWRSAKVRSELPFEALSRLGAKRKLSDLTPVELYDLLMAVAKKNIPLTRDFYKKVNAAFVLHRNNGVELPKPPTGLRLYATYMGEKAYCAAGEVFYHDNPSHSRVLLKDCKMLFLGSRVGVDNVCQHFGTKKLDDSLVEITEKVLVEKVFQEEFNRDYQNKIVGLSILLSRRREITSDECQQVFSRVSIVLVSSLTYSYDNGEQRSLSAAEYIKDPRQDGLFYVCVGDIASFPSLHIGQKQSRPFCRTIAAVLCDIVKSSSEEMENEFFACYYDFEEKSTELKEKGYWVEALELPAPAPNFYRDHMRGLRNAFDVIREQSLRPMLWSWLNLRRELQKYYRKYLEYYCDAVSAALLDGNALAIFCTENENLELSVQDYLDRMTRFVKENTCCCGGALEVPAFDWEHAERFLDWVEPNPEELYPGLYSRVSELDNPEALSLMFFDGNEDRISQFLQQAITANAPVADAEPVAAALPLLVRAAGDTAFLKPAEPIVSIGDVSLGGQGTGQATTEKKNSGMRKRGDEAEKLVEYWLRNDPANVGRVMNVTRVSGSSHTSTRSDRLHHDITYIEGGQTYYVEVKACDSGEFFLSSWELGFARNNPATYRLALVSLEDRTIKIVEDVYAKLNGIGLPVNWKVLIKNES